VKYRGSFVRFAPWFAGAAGMLLASVLLVGQAHTPVPGDPLPGVTPVEFEEFRLGLDDFLEVEAADEGLGPAFNGTSCAVCHSVPAVGGGSAISEIRAGRRGPRGEFIALDESGESLFHLFSLPSHGCQPVIPPDATIIARRVPIPVFGAGLVEAIPDETLLALEDPADRNRDGISGRAAIVVDRATGERRVGRFGWKAQHATLLAFGADAYRNEMGITNDLFREESAYGISKERMRLCDRLPEP
jgi:Di-haem oxidoreductase, putative peroxidase